MTYSDEWGRGRGGVKAKGDVPQIQQNFFASLMDGPLVPLKYCSEVMRDYLLSGEIQTSFETSKTNMPKALFNAQIPPFIQS